MVRAKRIAQWSTLLVAVGVLSSCATSAPEPEAETEVPAIESGAILPPPFTAAQIRDATPAGRTYVFRLTAAGRPPRERTMVFDSVDDEMALIRTDEGGGGGMQSTTWEALEEHAHFDASLATRERTTLTVMGLQMEAWLYVVSGEDPGGPYVERFWFALDLPGAPVVWEREAAGEVVFRNELVGHEPPLTATLRAPMPTAP